MTMAAEGNTSANLAAFSNVCAFETTFFKPSGRVATRRQTNRRCCSAYSRVKGCFELRSTKSDCRFAAVARSMRCAHQSCSIPNLQTSCETSARSSSQIFGTPGGKPMSGIWLPHLPTRTPHSFRTTRQAQPTLGGPRCEIPCCTAESTCCP